MSLQQPVKKANKYRSISIEQNSLHIEQLSRIGLLMNVLKPSIIKKKHLKSQQKQLNMKHNQEMNEVSSAFMHCLHMDLTPYQTLKQLIVQNKQLAKQSQSAYFLSKQAHKLINFIDGWAQLSTNPNLYSEYNFVFIDQKQQGKKISSDNNRRRSNDKNKSQTAYKQQERQQLKQRLKQHQKIRKQGQNQLKRIDQVVMKKKVSQKLSTKPALILDQQINPNTNQIKYEEYQNQEKQLDIEVQQISISKCDQNNMNSSNLNIREQNNKKIKENNKIPKLNSKGQTNNNKVIKLYSNRHQQNQNQNQNLSSNHHQNNLGFQQKIYLNQIIRPQYQKTQVSFSSNSSLSQSRQSQTVTKQVIVKKKTVIPLLKKGKQSSVSYNDVMKKKVSKINQIEENNTNFIIVNKENKSSLQNKVEIQNNRVENEMIEKGFMSQDTDANSRLTVITKKGKVTTNKNDQVRSLSPKVEGRKKVVVKLSSNLNKKQPNNQNQLSDNGNQLQKVVIKNKSISSSQQQTNKLSKQLQQLQQQFMNMNIRKSLQKEKNNGNKQNKQLKEDYHNNDKSNEGYLIAQQQNQLYIKPITNNENKTLQLIMKTQKHNNNNNKSTQQKSIVDSNNNTNSNRSKVLVNNHQLNSIVMQQEPWQCDQLQIQEQLKAIDEKIQDRKSILSKRQLNQTYNTNNSNTAFNQTYNDPFNQTTNCDDRLFPNDHVNMNNINKNINNNNRHKRSNTTVNNNTQQRQYFNHYQQQRVYTEHLFQDQNQQELHQLEQHHTNQPKVVRLSLTALAQNINKKSRDSIKHNHHHHQPNNIHKNHTSKPNHNNNPLPYSHQINRNLSQNKLQKDTSQAKLNKDTSLAKLNNDISQTKLNKETSQVKLNKETSQTKLNKEPSCKSILLFEQASKRGISPSKSNRSLRSNNRDISPIKQYNQKDFNNMVRTPRNMHKNPIKQRQNIKIYQSQSVPYLGNHSPSPLNRNNINKTPLNRDNRSRTPPNKGRQQQISNFSPLQYNNNNEDKNKLIYLKNHQHYPQEFSSHSRTLSDMIDSEYSRAKKMGYGQNNQYFNAVQNENIVRQRYQQYQNVGNNQYLLRQNPNQKDYSMYSNCERYFYGNEQNEEEQMNRKEVLIGNKWKVPINSNKNISPMNRNRTKVLLSDQLGG